ncbi:MAG: hypothetical protein LR015_02755, partial [Verrucomicrobia bacterium]|nr:hypothetical protein [Verrucomicrobiota bacterium]
TWIWILIWIQGLRTIRRRQDFTGDGPPDAFGLGAAVSRTIGGTRSGTGNPVWNRFAQTVQGNISEAIRRDPRFRNANLSLEVRVWADETGQITRAHLNNTGMNPDLENILREEILTGLRLTAVPPEDLPMPVVMRVNIRRPN